MKPTWKKWIEKKAAGCLWRRSTPLPVKELAWRAVWFVAKCGRSNPVSFALRPVATRWNLRLGTGFLLVIFCFLTASYGTLPVFGANSGGAFSVALNSFQAGVSVTTEETVQMPLENMDKSQGYWLLHAGVDLRAPIGTPIKPIMAGQVIKTEKTKGGYGNLVVVAHQANFESWYAHLSKIEVVEGQKVDLATKLGEVGSTGRSTGPHLHLEIRENRKAINPDQFLRLEK